MQLASTLPHSIGNIASWMMFKLTNLLTVFIIHTSSIKGEIPSCMVVLLVFWWLQPRQSLILQSQTRSDVAFICQFRPPYVSSQSFTLHYLQNRDLVTLQQSLLLQQNVAATNQIHVRCLFSCTYCHKFIKFNIVSAAQAEAFLPF